MRSGKLGTEGALVDFSVSERLALPRFAAAKLRHYCELCKAMAGAGQILKSQQLDTQYPSHRSARFPDVGAGPVPARTVIRRYVRAKKNAVAGVRAGTGPAPTLAGYPFSRI